LSKQAKLAIVAVPRFHFGNNDAIDRLLLTIRQQKPGKMVLVYDLKNMVQLKIIN